MKLINSSTVEQEIRTANGTKTIRLNRNKAIKTMCLEECNCGDHDGVKNCKSTMCPLFAFRFGGSAAAALKKQEELKTKVKTKILGRGRKKKLDSAK